MVRFSKSNGEGYAAPITEVPVVRIGDNIAHAPVLSRLHSRAEKAEQVEVSCERDSRGNKLQIIKDRIRSRERLFACTSIGNAMVVGGADEKMSKVFKPLMRRIATTLQEFGYIKTHNPSVMLSAVRFEGSRIMMKQKKPSSSSPSLLPDRRRRAVCTSCPRRTSKGHVAREATVLLLHNDRQSSYQGHAAMAFGGENITRDPGILFHLLRVPARGASHHAQIRTQQDPSRTRLRSERSEKSKVQPPIHQQHSLSEIRGRKPELERRSAARVPQDARQDADVSELHSGRYELPTDHDHILIYATRCIRSDDSVNVFEKRQNAVKDDDDALEGAGADDHAAHVGLSAASRSMSRSAVRVHSRHLRPYSRWHPYG